MGDIVHVTIKDEVLGPIPYEVAHDVPGRLHRATAIFIYRNATKKEVLLKRRSDRMDRGAGQWEPGAAGHSRTIGLTPELPLETGSRETLEELFQGAETLPDTLDLNCVGKLHHSSRASNNEWVYVFEAVYDPDRDVPFALNEEGKEWRWWKWGELVKAMDEDYRQEGKERVLIFTQTFHNVMRQYVPFRKNKKSAIHAPDWHGNV
ncbi:hypothetical protein CMO91_06110 [Candidatus Woesearchaeota archaeon]|nr:hypothetical protein [Candidatus Woesearchaeota archaeon]|tara:strand:- start:1081 stop:1698 length:618 start_codon:yes stop_codon:yes gene_type:complete